MTLSTLRRRVFSAVAAVGLALVLMVTGAAPAMADASGDFGDAKGCLSTVTGHPHETVHHGVLDSHNPSGLVNMVAYYDFCFVAQRVPLKNVPPRIDWAHVNFQLHGWDPFVSYRVEQGAWSGQFTTHATFNFVLVLEPRAWGTVALPTPVPIPMKFEIDTIDRTVKMDPLGNPWPWDPVDHF